MDEQVKDPTTIDEQIHILSERGMRVDADLARQWLRSVSYYRMSGYWYPYREQLGLKDKKSWSEPDLSALRCEKVWFKVVGGQL